MWYDEDDCLPLSAIQHFAFCPRQFALIHIERVWAENILTFEGRAMHERADDPFFVESRGTVLISRAVPLLSRKLGLYGVADVVEFHLVETGGVTLQGREGCWQPYPVEYKRGYAKPDDCDMVHLCAQAVCLEEMLCTRVPEGALFYGKTRRRQIVHFDERQRQRVSDLSASMHAQYASGETPPPRRTKGCDKCSLKDLCLPRICTKKNVRRYVSAIKAQTNRREDAP